MFAKVTSAVLVALGVTHASLAYASSDALSLAKEAGFDHAKFAVGVNLAAARNSPAFKEIYKSVLSRDANLKALLDHAKTDCGFDVVQVIQSVVIVNSDSETDRGERFYVSTKGTSVDSISQCIVKLAKREQKTATARDTDGIIEVTSDMGKDYVAVSPKGVLVFYAHAGDRAMLKRALKKNSAPSALGEAIAKVNTDAYFWGVLASPQKLDSDAKVNAANGTFNCTDAKCEVRLNADMDSESTARASVQKLDEEIERLARESDTPPFVAQIAKSVQLTSSGNRFQMRVNFTEATLVALAKVLIEKQ